MFEVLPEAALDHLPTKMLKLLHFHRLAQETSSLFLFLFVYLYSFILVFFHLSFDSISILTKYPRAGLPPLPPMTSSRYRSLAEAQSVLCVVFFLFFHILTPNL